MALAANMRLRGVAASSRKRTKRHNNESTPVISAVTAGVLSCTFSLRAQSVKAKRVIITGAGLAGFSCPLEDKTSMWPAPEMCPIQGLHPEPRCALYPLLLRTIDYVLTGPTSIATRHTSSLKCLPAENLCTSSMTS